MELCRKTATFLCLGMAVACFTASVANAQQVSRGSFTLPCAAELGKHMLPKGSYDYTVQQTGMTGAIVTITRVSDSSRSVEMMGLQSSPDASFQGGGSTLVVTHRGDRDFLQGIYLTDLGVEYTFPVHAKRKVLAAANSKLAQKHELTLRIPLRRPAK